MKFDNECSARAAFELAFGRILLMCGRPFRIGDIEVYEDCKSIMMDAWEYLHGDFPVVDSINYRLDRMNNLDIWLQQEG